ncbi:hypothetical protein FDECE_7981 [Fusarium decemcellulare]|nr:hypothetical protein FDECE_7981 [Fusarium decemcellulare]
MFPILLLFGAAIAQTCYYPNGSKATDKKYQPCGNANTTYSICCALGEGDRCLRNGLCSYPDHYYYRAACQDKDWSGCQEVCPGKKNGTWVQVKQCASNEFCCNLDSSKDCCSNNAERFSLDSPKPSTGTSDSSSSTSTPVGAIAGGVVGGIGAIALVLGLIWWLLRRKKKQAETSTPLKGAYDGEDTTSKTSDGSLSARQPLVEADAGPEAVLVESDARPVQPRRVHELPA